MFIRLMGQFQVQDIMGRDFTPRGAKARAILSGSFHVTPEHVQAVARPVLRHRILTNFNAEADQVTTDAIVDALLRDIPVEGASASDKKLMDAAVR